jgi:methyl-accepting chemotaxis protein
LTNEIKDQTQIAAVNIEKTVEMIGKNSMETKNTGKKFSEMADLIDRVKNTVDSVMTFLSEESSKVKAAFNEIDKVAAVSEETAANSQEVNASCHTSSDSMIKLDSISEQLHSMSAKQSILIKDFVKKSELSEVQMKESNHIMKQLAELSKYPGITCMSKEQIPEILIDFHMKNKLLDFVYVLNDKGIVIASSNSSGIGADFSFRPWFIEVLNGKNHITKIYISLITHTPCITVAVPVYGGNKNISGTLLANLKIMDI